MFDENVISDLYKDAYGYRPSFDAWNAMSETEKQIEFDNLVNEVERQVRDEIIAQKEAVIVFKTHLRKMAKDLSVSFATVLRWEMSAENIDPSNDQDIDLFSWHRGLDPVKGPKFIKRILQGG